MDEGRLAGRVVLVAGDVDVLGEIAAALHRAGAQVALVGPAESARTDVTVHMRADPADPAIWDRVVMHVEQHLGPVDAAVADLATGAAAQTVLGPDLVRRGRGDVVVVGADPDVEETVRRVADTQRATPP